MTDKGSCLCLVYPTYYFEHKPHDITTTANITRHAMPPPIVVCHPSRLGSPYHICIFVQPLSHPKTFLPPETIEFSSAPFPTLTPWLCSKWNLTVPVWPLGTGDFWSVWHPVLKGHPRCCAIVTFFFFFDVLVVSRFGQLQRCCECHFPVWFKS